MLDERARCVVLVQGLGGGEAAALSSALCLASLRTWMEEHRDVSPEQTLREAFLHADDLLAQEGRISRQELGAHVVMLYLPRETEGMDEASLASKALFAWAGPVVVALVDDQGVRFRGGSTRSMDRLVSLGGRDPSGSGEPDIHLGEARSLQAGEWLLLAVEGFALQAWELPPLLQGLAPSDAVTRLGRLSLERNPGQPPCFALLAFASETADLVPGSTSLAAQPGPTPKRRVPWLLALFAVGIVSVMTWRSWHALPPPLPEPTVHTPSPPSVLAPIPPHGTPLP
jgi:hypothetical protein